MQFFRSTEGDKIFTDKGGIKKWLKVCRERILMFLSCKKTGQNKSTTKDFTNKI
jgi:hypothetical protein